MMNLHYFSLLLQTIRYSVNFTFEIAAKTTFLRMTIMLLYSNSEFSPLLGDCFGLFFCRLHDTADQQ